MTEAVWRRTSSDCCLLFFQHQWLGYKAPCLKNHKCTCCTSQLRTRASRPFAVVTRLRCGNCAFSTGFLHCHSTVPFGRINPPKSLQRWQRCHLLKFSTCLSLEWAGTWTQLVTFAFCNLQGGTSQFLCNIQMKKSLLWLAISSHLQCFFLQQGISRKTDPNGKAMCRIVCEHVTTFQGESSLLVSKHIVIFLSSCSTGKDSWTNP